MEYVKLGLLVFCLANAGVKFALATTCQFEDLNASGAETKITDDVGAGHILAVFKKSTNPGGTFVVPHIEPAAYADFFDLSIFTDEVGGAQYLIVKTKRGISEVVDGATDHTLITPTVFVQCLADTPADITRKLSWTITVQDTDNKGPSFPEESLHIKADLTGWTVDKVYETIDITDSDRAQGLAEIDSIAVTSDTDPVPVVASLGTIGDVHPWVTPLDIKLVDGNVKLGNHTVTLVATSGSHHTETKVTIEVFKSSGTALAGTFFTVTLLSLISSKIKNY